MHYYKRNIGDYSKKAGRLTMLQHGAYTLLMDACYDREHFPTKEEAIEWTWASSAAEVEAIEFVLRKFFQLEDGVYVQKRVEEELKKYQTQAETNARIAREREAKRRGFVKNDEHDVHEACTTRAQGANDSPPNHKPRTINQEPITNNQEVKEDPRRRAPRSSLPSCPEEVDSQVWSDWLALRKAKRAPVTSTVIDSARQEAEKAGLSFDAFLRVWCARGSQGLQADWLKPHERGQPQPMPMTRQQGVEARNRATVERYLARMEAEGDEQDAND